MWNPARFQYQIGPFLFTVMGDPASWILGNNECQRLMIRCQYDSKMSDDFVANRPTGNSDFVTVVHKEYGNMDRPWHDRHGNRWARMFASDSSMGLVGLLAVEIARHWLEEATGYELQHMPDEVYTKIQGWFLGKQEDY